MIKRIESGIAGSGLGFNYIFDVRKLAALYPIKGTAFVKGDGSIKVIAEGEEAALTDFVRHLSKLNALSSIENFYVNWSEPTESFGNFYVAAN